MELEKVYKSFGPTIRYLVKSSDLSEDEVKELIAMSWEFGYEFRKQEEQINKGASF